MAAPNALNRKRPTPLQFSAVKQMVTDPTDRIDSDMIIYSSFWHKTVTRHWETSTGNS